MPAPEVDGELAGLLFAAEERHLHTLRQLLHDTLSQSLSGAVLTAAVLAARRKAGQAVEPAELDSLHQQLERALEETEAFAHQLQPISPRPDGLMTALTRLAEETVIPCSFACAEAIFLENPEVARALYRIAAGAVQSALADDPARATRVLISLVDRGEASVAITVQHDGSVPGAAELQLLRCRAEAVGGSLAVASNPATGVTITGIGPRASARLPN